MTEVRTVRVELFGDNMLMHADNIEWADQMDDWKNDPENKGKSKAGDDRTPPYRWIGCLNYDDPKTGVITIPSEYIMSCLRESSAQVTTGKGKKTFKAQSQSGIIPVDFHWCLKIKGKLIQMGDIQPLFKLKTFKEHQEAVQDLGFSLFVKRVKIGASKHIRVRPRFDDWSVSGDLQIIDDEISDKQLERFFDIGGRYKGLGDWRPGAKTPGQFGTFKAKITSKH